MQYSTAVPSLKTWASIFLEKTGFYVVEIGNFICNYDVIVDFNDVIKSPFVWIYKLTKNQGDSLCGMLAIISHPYDVIKLIFHLE